MPNCQFTCFSGKRKSPLSCHRLLLFLPDNCRVNFCCCIGLIHQVQMHFDLCWQKKKMILFALVFEMGFCRAAALPKDYGGNCIQMRLSYSPFAPIFLYFIEWMDYSCTDILPNYLGLLHILVYKVGCCSFFYAFLLIFCCLRFQIKLYIIVQVYMDGMPSMSSKEQKVTLREFYGMLLSS